MKATEGPNASVEGRREPPPLGGTYSVCSGHPLVIEAALVQAKADGALALIEGTCNQVNHQGGYTGLSPQAFRNEVIRIADRVGLARERLVLGGDHLGPAPWRHLPAEEAMDEAAAMVSEYVAAGYDKIHIDTSMGCEGEPDNVGDAVTAERGARLVRVAEGAALAKGTEPYYVIGTEVPTPGGALHEIDRLLVTQAQALQRTLEAHRAEFASAGVELAFDRVMAVVAQPGVEFDNQRVVVYEPSRAEGLASALEGTGLVLEAHSTDYQPQSCLSELVRDGFAILKVGPGLTFAMREALYSLDKVLWWLGGDRRSKTLPEVMEDEMLARPQWWAGHYHGAPAQLRYLRHFSYSDRIRYYWAGKGAQEAVDGLLSALATVRVPLPLISQFLPRLYDRVLAGELAADAQALLMESVRDAIRPYAAGISSAGRDYSGSRLGTWALRTGSR